MERESNPMQPMCRSGCGFYGNPATDGLCSVCYKDSLRKKQQPPVTSSTPVSVPSPQPSPTFTPAITVTNTAQPTVQSLQQHNEIKEAACESSSSSSSPPPTSSTTRTSSAVNIAVTPTTTTTIKKRKTAEVAATTASAAAAATTASSPTTIISSGVTSSCSSKAANILNCCSSDKSPTSCCSTSVSASYYSTSSNLISIRIMDSKESIKSSAKKRKLNEEHTAKDCATTAGPSTSTGEDQDDKEGDKDAKKKKNRCAVCRKKVGLTGFECRCGGLYCAVHRYSDKHDCTFDYREHGAQEIRRNNPVVVGEKIQKI